MSSPSSGLHFSDSSWRRIRRVLRLAIPSAGEMLLGMLVGLVNTYLVGHLGSASLTGVGLGVQWSMAAMVLFSAVGTGATALTARMIGAEEAERSNLVSRVVPAAELMEEAMKVAERIAHLSQPIVAMAKSAVNRAFETTLQEGVRYEKAVFYSAFATEDQKEGMAAFIAKREPSFNNK